MKMKPFFSIPPPEFIFVFLNRGPPFFHLKAIEGMVIKIDGNSELGVPVYYVIRFAEVIF